MTGPTIATRRERRCIAASSDCAFHDRVRAALPEGWALTGVRALREAGDFAAVLQHRFVLLDLEAAEPFDPVDVIHEARRDLMLNIAILCFGGSEARRGAARLAGADRFFEGSELAGRTGQFCEQYGW